MYAPPPSGKPILRFRSIYLFLFYFIFGVTHSSSQIIRHTHPWPSQPMMTSIPTFTPTTRSRTLLFISYRDSSARTPRASRSSPHYEDSYHPTDEHEGLINHHGGISLDVELPPKWFVRSEPRVSDNIPFSISLLACLGSTMSNR